MDELRDDEGRPLPPPKPDGSQLPPSPMAWYAEEAEVDVVRVSRFEPRSVLDTVAPALAGGVAVWYALEGTLNYVAAELRWVGLSDELADLSLGGAIAAALGPLMAALVGALVLNLVAGKTRGWRVRLREKRAWPAGERRVRWVSVASALRMATLAAGVAVAVPTAATFGLAMALGGLPPSPVALLGRLLVPAGYILRVVLVATVAAAVYNWLAQRSGGLQLVVSEGARAPSVSALGEGAEQVRVRGVGVLIPGLLGMTWALGCAVSVSAFIMTDLLVSTGEGLTLLGQFVTVSVVYVPLGFLLGALAACMFSLAGLVTGGLRVEVE